MVKIFSSKLDKHCLDDDKRRESLRKKVKEKLNQRLLIKNALSDSSAHRSGKRIVFDSKEIEGDETKLEDELGLPNGSGSPQKEEGRKSLFDELDNEESEEYEIKVKSCFEGKKGYKLLHLQSNYSNDERFRLDERFQDDISEDEAQNIKSINEHSDMVNYISAEKVKQIKLLEDVLGHPVYNKKGNEAKSRKGIFEMVRFDASNENHKRQKTNDEKVNGDIGMRRKSAKEKRDKVKKKLDNNEAEASKPTTSAEKFYEVSNDLKTALRNRKKESSSFSLLATFSENDLNKRGDADDNDYGKEDNEENDDKVTNEGKGNWKSEIESVNEQSNEEGEVSTKVHGIVNEKFFFANDDPRLEEGLNFINMKDSDELKQVMENYDKSRRDLREVLRLRLQKFRQRKNPFKRKIGGSETQVSNFHKSRKLKKFPVKRK